MTKISSLLCLLWLACLFPNLLFSQCNTATCLIPVPALNAQDACILPNPQALNCYYGQTTPDLPVSIPSTWCTDIDNNHWFAFTATSFSAFFIFNAYGCTYGNGIQVGIFTTSDCINFTPVSTCIGINTVTSYTLSVPGLTPGQVYYMCIDGTAGALCDYSINGTNPSINVAGSPNICLPTDPVSNYATASNSIWSIEPPGAGMINGNPVSSFVQITWLQPGPARVCAQSVACADAPLECLDVFVGGGVTEFQANLCEGGTVECGGNTYSLPGVYEDIYSSSTGCDSIVRCIIDLIPRDTSTVAATACQGDSVSCAGRFFHQSGDYFVQLNSSIGCDSVVKCQITILPRDTVHLGKITHCGPDTLRICDTLFTGSGLWSRTCTNRFGCDSTVTADFAVLAPRALILSPLTLHCHPDSTIRLYADSSTINNLTGGITQYHWQGPGIVGPDSLFSVVVQSPGTYCLSLTHGRDTIYCSDTACVTVLQNGFPPQMPILAGNFIYCGDTPGILSASAAGADSYQWTFTPSIVFTPLAPDSIAVTWPDSTFSGQVCVAASNQCGNSPEVCMNYEHHQTLFDRTVQLCEGNSILAGGGLQTTSGVYIDSLISVSGCDSILRTILTVLENDTLILSGATCLSQEAGVFTQILTQTNGCDSVVITQVLFVPADTTQVQSSTCDPAQAGVFSELLQNLQGCDSLVIRMVTLSPSDTTQVQASTCDPAQAGVFSELLQNLQGCDSLVIRTVTLSPSYTTQVQASTCDPAQAGVFSELLQNLQGCDSLVIRTVTLSPSDTTQVQASTCDPAQAGVFSVLLQNGQGCDSLVILTVTLSPSDTTQVQAFTCDPAQTGVFSELLQNLQGCDSLVIRMVTLSPSDTTQVQAFTCDPAQAGTVFEFLTNAAGCDSVVATVTTLLDPNDCGISVDLTDVVIPCNETTGILNFSVTQGQAPFDFTLYAGSSEVATGIVSNLQAEQQVGGLSPGSYVLELESANGLVIQVSVEVLQLEAPQLNIAVLSSYNQYPVSCPGALDGTVEAVVTGGQAPYSFSWTDGYTTAVVDHLGEGSYTVTVTDAQHCTTQAGITLDAPPELALGLDINGPGCFDAQNGAIQATGTGGVSPYTYQLNQQPGQSSGLFGNLDAGLYNIAVTDANGCSRSEAVLINAAVPPDVDLGDNRTILLGDQLTLQAVVNVPLDSILQISWMPAKDTATCTNCPEWVVMPLVTTTYSVQIITLNGCSGTDQVTLLVDRKKYIYAPTAFSPNDDGQNETFSLYVKPGAVSRIKRFQIFDRWGDRVYSQENFIPDTHQGWDGRVNGHLMDPAVFVWFAEIEFTDGDVEIFKGDVTLVR